MKWILRTILVILIVFAGLIGIGFFLPATQIVERHIEIDAYAEDVYPLIDDLRVSVTWDVGAERGSQIENIAFGGPDSGVGQTAAWQTNQTPPVTGTREIIESQSPEFVRSESNLNGVLTTQTFAISDFAETDAGVDGSSESVDVLLRTELELDGFPYLDRITAKIKEGGVKSKLDRTLKRLKTSAENQMSAFSKEE